MTVAGTRISPGAGADPAQREVPRTYVDFPGLQGPVAPGSVTQVLEAA